ncbi:MAG: molybdopterin-dependent oxidoreductase, partial [bacterium]
MSESNDDASTVTRRDFLKGMGVAGAGTYLSLATPFGMWSFDPAQNIDNPLAQYPNRDWEQVYRDQYAYDRSFEWVCAPNDTHMCRVKSYMRNGVMVRSEQNYDVQDYGDLYGNKSSAHWNPRMCPKGYTFHRRVYGPHRLKGPVVRKGWKQWADDGFPSLSDNPELRSKYKFDDRGNDEYVRLSWDEISDYAARGLKAIAETYSGDEGRRRLEKDGYNESMFKNWNGAGTRTMKMGSNLPIHGIVGKFGLFRMGNLMGLLDHHVRDVDPDDAQGIREWTEYTWRGDQAPGHPFVHGLQTSDCDFNDLRETKLHVQVGKNLVENKMPESHWFIEMMERGGKIVSIAPEYNAPATKADYWIGVRAGLSDTSIFLYIAKHMIDNNLYDAEFVKKYTDFPLLMRKDNLERLQPSEVIDGYEPPSLEGGPSMERHGLTKEQREKVGDFMVYDKKSGSLEPITREHVGEQLTKDGIDPALSWEGTVETTDGESVEVMTIFDGYKIHLRDYDLDTVAEISHGDKEKIKQLAEDLATIQPAAIHHGEGINHYFHATEHNRA